jgi:hypothetical protein
VADRFLRFFQRLIQIAVQDVIVGARTRASGFSAFHLQASWIAQQFGLARIAFFLRGPNLERPKS